MSTPTQKKSRTYARNRMVSRRGKERIYETDTVFILKLVCVVLIGTLWIKFHQPISFANLVLTGIPLGAVIGIFIVSRYESIQFNRKIWYVVLLMITLVSYFVPAGIVL